MLHKNIPNIFKSLLLNTCIDKHDILETLPGPDFSTGAELLFDEMATREIYSTGRGSFKLRAKWRYEKKENVIEIYEIPYSTTSEAIMDKVAANAVEYLAWAASLPPVQRKSVNQSTTGHYSAVLGFVLNNLQRFEQKELFNKYFELYSQYASVR